jgi:iron complex outermembrane receptor protein
MSRKSGLRVACLGAVSVLALTVSAAAQDNNSSVEQVIVTGSHIARPEVDSPMPVSVINMDDAKEFGRDSAYDALLLNPAIGPGMGATSSYGSEFDQGVANINLRNMGNNRSLVLVDGERWVSGGARTSAVDLNTIPAAMIDHIETVTGGAAAIYGADAVTGAVNIIMKKEITGLHISATAGVSGHGDSNQDDVSVTTGFNFAGDRGHFAIGGNYNYTAPLQDLDRYTNRVAYYANPAFTGPNSGVPANILDNNTRQVNRTSFPTFCLPVACGAGSQWYGVQNGAVTPISFNNIDVSGLTGSQSGGPGANDMENVLLRNGSTRASVYSHLSYELTPAITWNTTFSYAYSYTHATPEWPQVRDDGRPTNWWGGTTGEVAMLNNPYLPSSLQQFMVANNLTQVPLDRTYLNLPEAFENHHRNNVTIGTDIGGALTDKLTWSAFVRYGEVTDHITTTNMVGKSEWLNARYPITDPVSGQIECASATARAAGCVPFNIFSASAPSQAFDNYAEFDRYEATKNSQVNTGANITGDIFSLPAGDVSVAAGLAWRRETLHTRDDPNTAKLSDIVFSPGEDYALHPAIDAARNTVEGYGEVVVPVLKDLPLAKRVELEGAYRYSEYTAQPDTNTWKIGGTWAPVDELTLRGVASHSVRVPNFGELYSPPSTVTLGNINDPCSGPIITQGPNRPANCAALLPGVALPLPFPNLNAPQVFSGGNPKLTPEKSNSFTLGAVYQPQFLPGFDLTVDYWNIAISNVITQLSYLTILDACVDSAGGPNKTYCSFITRNADGSVNNVQAQYANLAAQKARGLDIGANYRTDLWDGEFRAALNGTYLFEQQTVAQVGTPGINFANEFDNPTFKATLITNYSIGQFTFGLNTRFISLARINATDAGPQTRSPYNVPAYVYNDLTAQYRPADGYAVTLGINNISDVGIFGPLQYNNLGPHASGGDADGAAYYDPIGRYFFIKLDVDLEKGISELLP